MYPIAPGSSFHPPTMLVAGVVVALVHKSGDCFSAALGTPVIIAGQMTCLHLFSNNIWRVSGGFSVRNGRFATPSETKCKIGDDAGCIFFFYFNFVGADQIVSVNNTYTHTHSPAYSHSQSAGNPRNGIIWHDRPIWH